MKIVKEPTFSFIIPVYNTAKLLPRCLSSIIEQDNFEIEILLIDDGSTDNSFDVCQQYSSRYPFIKAVKKQNEGQGVARNLGMEMARGRFLCFVDSDDYIEPSYCRSIYDAFLRTDADFLNFGCSFKNGREEEIRRIIPPAGTAPIARRIFLDALLIRGILSSPWSKAFKRDFLLNNNIRFPPVRANEDILFSCLVARSARTTAFISASLYNVLIRPGSTSRAMNPMIFRETERMMTLGRASFTEELLDPEVSLHFDAHIARVFSYLLFQGAVRMRTPAELREAFDIADECGLSRIVKDGRALQLLPLKNQIMARMTARRRIFRPIVRLLKRLLIKAY